MQPHRPRNADFYVSVDLYDQAEQPMPVITKARAVFTPGLLRMPSYELVGPLLDKLRHEVSRTTWSEKEPRLFWRGGMRSFNSCQCGGHIPGRAEWPARWRKFNGSTLLEMAAAAPQPGGRLPLTPRCHCQAHWTNSSTFKRNNRIRLCELSRQFPQLIDAKLAYIPDSYDSIRQRLLDLGYAAEFSQKTEQTKYKYLISTDGSTIDDTRIYWLLSTGSVIFKQITPLLPYGIPGLVPWQHFVPIREDMSDLVDKIRFAQANDDSMKQIALRAQHFAKNFFTEVVSLEKAVVTGINGGHVHVASTDCPPWRPLFQTYYLAVDALVLMLDISSGRTPSEPAKFESAIAQDVEGVRNFLCKFDDWEACPLLILCHATDTESVAFDAERIRGEIGKCELRRLPNRVRHFSWSSPSLLSELREDLAWLVTAKEQILHYIYRVIHAYHGLFDD
ncbi:KDEL motif-containing protein 2 [Symbiodinium microadriaticum]|uniref:KDEL motif-containing protein 2 n=1 Tax=Symbiodinium microadriaticum TaxID=2951 RepID=A0A1Q9CAC8_SYMMI|nr:KDEL motif-containing protein 2 [Symbiodinium microadriaticum]